ncbi:MAG: amino acid transporter, partial [Gemmatimonadales bacterium]
ILLMGFAALAALMYTIGDVGHLVVMYSINVFLTFSLSMLAMLRFWLRHRKVRPEWRTRIGLFVLGLALCGTILLVTLYEKFSAGGWITVVITTLVITLCFVIRRHYRAVNAQLDRLYQELDDLPLPSTPAPAVSPDPKLPMAAILVGSYGGVGIHTLLNVLRTFPGHFKGVLFISVGVIDSGEFKGEHALEELTRRTEDVLARYVELAAGLGVPATSRLAIGTEAVSEAERVCLAIAREFPHVVFFAGKMIFKREKWYHRLLHNETALAVEKRLRWAGRTMVTMPIRVTQAR